MPSFVEPLPGTTRHQARLRAIVEAYEHDERILAIGVLGSVARGTWDEWSDRDLDIVTNEVSHRHATRRMSCMPADIPPLALSDGELTPIAATLRTAVIAACLERE